MIFEEALTFDDVLLVPKYSTVSSRKDVDISSFIVPPASDAQTIKLEAPFVSSPMATVTGHKMARAMVDYCGGVGVIHRFYPGDEEKSIAAQAEEVRLTLDKVGAAVGVTGMWQKRAETLIEAGADFIVVDIAHGNTKKHIDMLLEFVKLFPGVPIIAANVADADGTKRVCDTGAHGVRCGVGQGGLCTTRIMTGFGVPSVTSLMWCAQAINEGGYNVSLLQDGGIRYPADIVKSLALGADAVIMGGLLAGCTEAPGEVMHNVYENRSYKRYMGSASFSAKASNRFVEGAEKIIPANGPVRTVLEGLSDGVRSGFSYCGARNIIELRDNAQFVKVSQNGLKESHPHLLFQ